MGPSRPGVGLLVGFLVVIAGIVAGLGLVILTRPGAIGASDPSGHALGRPRRWAPPLRRDSPGPLAPRPFAFPADHGPHPAFRTEWWYWTGNLREAGGGGRRFGFQLTFFRTALAPPVTPRALRLGRARRVHGPLRR